MDLVIVESPTKEKTISKLLNNKAHSFVVKSSCGHIRDLPKKSLGINIAKNFQPQYVILSKAKKILSQLKSIATKAQNVYLATDFDREGEAIAWHLVQSVPIPQEKTKRITFHEITPAALEYAIKHPKVIDMNLVNAQQARRVLDRLVGYKLSPLLWRKITRGLSAGRVQSVALRFICEREKEIANFNPREYWTLSVELAYKGSNFKSELVEMKDKKLDKYDLGDKFAVEKIISDLKGADFVIKEVKKKEKLRKPAPPFTTALLQQEAAKRFHFSPSKTMFLSQMLYEGVDIGEKGPVGLITYMRTDSMYISSFSQQEARKFILEKYGKDYLPAKMPHYQTKIKTAQEAHEAIRPTNVYYEPEKIKQYLTPEQYKLYKMIWLRFVCSQSKEAILDTTTVDIFADDYLFRASGSIIKFGGFLDIDTEAKKDITEIVLPEMSSGEPLVFVRFLPEQHFTEPPPRYTAASLIKELEKNGIGRPSTYAPTIETLLERGYVKIQEYKFHPTELGTKVDNLLKNFFPKIVDKDFTAQMEDKLDKIVSGEIPWQRIISDFYGPFMHDLDIAEKKIVKEKTSIPTDKKCTICGAVMLLRSSRYGQFLSCSNWPKCKSKLPLQKNSINEHKSVDNG